MRGIFIFLLMLTIKCLYSSNLEQAMKSILIYSRNANPSVDDGKPRSTFLIEDKCMGLQGGNQLKNNDETSVPGRASEFCSNTIAFVPINKNKIQVFVSVENKKLKSADIIYKNLRLFTCDKKGMTKLNNEANDKLQIDQLFKIKTNEEKLEPNQEQGISYFPTVYCQSVTLEDENLAKVFHVETNSNPLGEWTMKINNEDLQKDIKGKLNADIFSKMRCDPEKLVFPDTIDDKTLQITNQELKPIVNKKIDDLYLVINGEPKFKSHVDGKVCDVENTGSMLLYSTNGKWKPARKVECLEESTNNWKWKVETVNVNSNQFEKVDVDEKLSLICARRKCRTCEKKGMTPEPKCPIESENCTIPREIKSKIDFGKPETYNFFNDCYELKCDEKSKIAIFLNNKDILKIEGETKCVENKYSINQYEVEHMYCMNKFPITKNDVSERTVNNTIMEKIDAVKPGNCQLNECECFNKTAKYKLAFSNKNGTKWIRINSIKFDEILNIWNYTRTVNGTETMYQLESNRAVRCIPPEVQHQKWNPDALKNENSNLVFVVNAVIIILSIAITTPSVILFVNAKEKKREALKATKKEKGAKMEDKSGDKKNSVDKKDEEKKNEA